MTPCARTYRSRSPSEEHAKGLNVQRRVESPVEVAIPVLHHRQVWVGKDAEGNAIYDVEPAETQQVVTVTQTVLVADVVPPCPQAEYVCVLEPGHGGLHMCQCRTAYLCGSACGGAGGCA